MSSSIHGYNVNNSTKLSYIGTYVPTIYVGIPSQNIHYHSLPYVGSWAYSNTVPFTKYSLVIHDAILPHGMVSTYIGRCMYAAGVYASTGGGSDEEGGDGEVHFCC